KTSGRASSCRARPDGSRPPWCAPTAAARPSRHELLRVPGAAEDCEMTVDPFFNDRATIAVFERAFYAGREAAEEVDAILEWAPRPRRVLDVGCNAGL